LGNAGEVYASAISTTVCIVFEQDSCRGEKGNTVPFDGLDELEKRRSYYPSRLVSLP
jgi:hypothetical protein